ncbi:hypothetical protein CHS0354_028232 [Potamilus streckersoni]|uniref:HECT domain-containing protein n=1 Tax=Potamilus streckersoni TaxID=2493646 RepID=A0AAE0VIV0_9BIVA|nr:hypothetical protein CHS0354_028232 [Potamilus streckersoni]
MADEQNYMPSDTVALISDAVTGHQLDQGVTITDPLASIADDSSEFHLDQDSTHPNLDETREDAFTVPQLDQDESNLQAAIQASLRRNPTCAEILKEWISSNLHDNEEESVTIIVHRRKILDSTRRAVSRTGFSFFKPVKVIFAGEIREDSGGPKREYYRLLMKEIRDDILEGTNFQHSISKLENMSYWYAGRCIAWSILQSGPGFPFLSHTVFGIVTGNTNFQPNLEDITDLDAKSSILKIQDATSLEDMEEISDWILEQGLPLLTSFDEESKKIQLKLLCVIYLHSGRVLVRSRL